MRYFVLSFATVCLAVGITLPVRAEGLGSGPAVNYGATPHVAGMIGNNGTEYTVVSTGRASVLLDTATGKSILTSRLTNIEEATAFFQSQLTQNLVQTELSRPDNADEDLVNGLAHMDQVQALVALTSHFIDQTLPTNTGKPQVTSDGILFQSHDLRTEAEQKAKQCEAQAQTDLEYARMADLANSGGSDLFIDQWLLSRGVPAAEIDHQREVFKRQAATAQKVIDDREAMKKANERFKDETKPEPEPGLESPLIDPIDIISGAFVGGALKAAAGGGAKAVVNAAVKDAAKEIVTGPITNGAANNVSNAKSQPSDPYGLYMQGYNTILCGSSTCK